MKIFPRLPLVILPFTLAACGGGGGGGDAPPPPAATAPTSAASATLSLAATKKFQFAWTDVADATHYRLLENPDGSSGFTQVGTDISSGSEAVIHIVPLYQRLNASYILQSCNSAGCTDGSAMNVSGTLVDAIGYIKAGNTEASDEFGYSVSLSGDGNTLAIGASGEDSSTTGINSTPNELASSAGAVYVFSHSGNSWSQQAYVKASNTGALDNFGYSVSLSGDGNTLAVGAPFEDSSTIGINSTPDESASGAGAVYIFSRSGSNWSQQAYVKASNTGADDWFGESVSLSKDGNTLAVGAQNEDSSSTGINSTPNELAADAGAVYVFSRSGSSWSQQAYVKASNTEGADWFGGSISLSAEGNTLAVGASGEDSSTTGINSTPDESASNAGAVYIFSYSGSSWSQQAYVKASNTETGDWFGRSVSLSTDGGTLAVGAFFEDSSTTGINSISDELASNAGAVYVYTHSGSNWSQQAYVKASNTGAGDRFGAPVNLSADGNTLAVGAYHEASSSTSLNSTSDELASEAGAVYVYSRSGSSWSQQAYAKASNTGANDHFGRSLSLSGDGRTLAVGARGEDSSSTGINSTPNELASEAGAVYVY